MRSITQIMQTMLLLIALYLVLRFGANAGRVIFAIGRGLLVPTFKTLQGR